jgi:hypothetical protein
MKMRKWIVATLTTAMLMLGGGAAFADSPHAPGNSEAGPNDANAHCLPYGLHDDDPQCKGP